MEKNRGKFRNGVVVLVLIFMAVSLACGISRRVPEAEITAVPVIEQPAGVSTATLIPVPTLVPVFTSAPVFTATIPPPSPTAAATTSEQLYLGDSTSAYGYTLTPLRIDDPAEPGVLFEPVDGKRLIAVEIIVANISGEVLKANPLNVQLIVMGGNVFDLELLGVDNRMASVSLYPGERVQGWVAYLIPEGAVPAKLVMKSSILNDNDLEVKLDRPPVDHVSAPIEFVPRTETTKIGSSIQVMGYEMVVNNVEDPTTPGALFTPVDGYKLVAVDVTLRNISGSAKLDVNALNVSLVDTDGFMYACELLAKDDSIGFAELAVGEQIQGWLAFLIHEDAAPAYIKYQIDGFSENYLVSGLAR